MSEEQNFTNLDQLLNRIERATEGDGDRVSLGDILEMVGRRSYGVVLLLAGLIVLAPLIGDIPGVPTLMAMVVILITVQLLTGREHFWLPEWLLVRSVEKGKLRKAVKWSRRPARFIDRYLRSRFTPLVESVGIYAISSVCLIIALALPVMEFIPFSANGAGIAFTIFGLSLIARDGLLALTGFLVTAATFGLILAGIL